jgi:hypothetical protein
MKRLLALMGALAIVQTAAAAGSLPEDQYRGGWETYGQQGAHIYEFSIRGSNVRGIYCTSCNDGTTLAFVDGTLNQSGLSFVVTHVRDDGSTAYLDHATARFDHGQLIVDGDGGAPGAGHFHYVMRKDPRGPAPLPGGPVGTLPPGVPVPPVHFPASTQPPPVIPTAADNPWWHRICQYLEPRTCPYMSPGPPEQLTADKVVGVWVGLRDGPGKQLFFIRRVGQQLRGMVCGPCDNPYTMAALGDFRIDGDTLRFNILHEDWGRPGYIPFHNQITAHVSQNEMRIINVPDRGAQQNRSGRPVAGGNTLFGPIPVEATRGNVPSGVTA